MKTMYMLTVIYIGGRTVDIEFCNDDDRKTFFRCIKDTECKFTFWEQIVVDGEA